MGEIRRGTTLVEGFARNCGGLPQARAWYPRVRARGLAREQTETLRRVSTLHPMRTYTKVMLDDDQGGTSAETELLSLTGVPADPWAKDDPDTAAPDGAGELLDADADDLSE